MEAAELQPRVAPDGQSIAFALSRRGRNIDCQVAREVLEQHFWVPPGATETRILRAFADGADALWPWQSARCSRTVVNGLS
ncbi:DUF1488 family protein [Burkholderia stagnalis]|uniref:DUF1488 family protein n=1 Tax=Burkholderia stagnalis TaxID=1503054 RepID=UPI002892FF62|nr:DUF1488 family protein [Burkholderia stagnalis]